MKKLILSISSLVLLITIITCKKELNTSESSPQLITVESFKFVGEEHNNGLDYVYNKIKLLKLDTIQKSSLNKEDMMLYIKKFSVEFVDLKSNNGLVNSEAIKRIDFIHKFQRDYHFKSSPNDLILIADSLRDKFSPNLISLLDDLKIVLTSDSTSLTERITLIENIESGKLINELSDMERMIILSSSSVAKSSLTYWSENYDKWSHLLDNNMKSWWPNLKEIGLSDAAGAVIGATHLALSGTGALMVAGGPGGWVGIGMVVAGCGLEASAVSAFLSLF